MARTAVGTSMRAVHMITGTSGAIRFSSGSASMPPRRGMFTSRRITDGRSAPKNGVGHLLSAYHHLAFRQIGPAKSEFQSVLDLDPYHPRALLGLAKIALEERDLAACRPFLDKALQYYPDFPEARALQEMVSSWTMTAAPAGQRPAYAGPPIQVEKLKPPA